MLINKSRRDAGFTLLELLIALVIFAVGILGVYSMQITSITGNTKSRVISEASVVAADQVEQFLSVEYDNWTDTDGDGTGQDTNITNGDGVDDDGGNFGLDDVTVATADGTDDFNGDGVADVFWNVAFDYPYPNTKTVRIYVDPQDSDSNMVPITFVLADPTL